MLSEPAPADAGLPPADLRELSPADNFNHPFEGWWFVAAQFVLVIALVIIFLL